MKKMFIAYFLLGSTISLMAVSQTNKIAGKSTNTATSKAVATVITPVPASAPTIWTVDRAHSNAKFTVTHMVVSEVEGSFRSFEGTLEHTKPDFSDAKINFTIDVSSIYTDNDNRDKHLKSDDFFNAEKYPKMSFVSTSFKPLGNNNKYLLEGNLTIRDVTKPVTFDVTYGGSTTNQGQTKAGFKAKTTINRFDYNLKWDRATEAGGLVVSKNVDVTINAEFNKGK